jgi:hypothetical protein
MDRAMEGPTQTRARSSAMDALFAGGSSDSDDDDIGGAE